MTSKQRLIANLKFIEECTLKDPSYLDCGICAVIETSLVYTWDETVFKVLDSDEVRLKLIRDCIEHLENESEI